MMSTLISPAGRVVQTITKVPRRRLSGARVAAAREAAAMTQRQVAASIGSTLATIENIEQERISDAMGSTLLALAELFGVSPSAFYE